MTVIVGMACADGAILAADSKASDPNTASAFQIEKIFTLANKCLVSASGHTAIIRDVRGQLLALENEIDQSPDVPVSLRSVIKPGLQSGYAQWVPVPGAHNIPPSTSFLAVGIADKGPWVAEIDSNGLMDRHENTLGYYAIGSGGGFAQMAMALMAHFGVRDRSTSVGMLIAYRVLDAVIHGSMAGVGHPISIWTVSRDVGCYQLDATELMEVANNVGAWQEAEKESLEALLGGSGSADRVMPPPLPDQT